MSCTAKIVVTLAVALLVGCGGGGGSGGALSTTTVSGIATDGYLEGAQVCMDLNDNGTCDAGEPTTTTSSTGGYQLTVNKSDEGNHQLLLVATAGQSADADVPGAKVLKSFVLATPKEYSGIISPLTTAVVATKSVNSLSTDAAAAQVFQTLSLNDNNLSAANLFHDFSSTSNQQANPSLIKLSNFAKAINVNIANQTSISESTTAVSTVIANAATATKINDNIINSSLINSINSSTAITTQNLQANLISSDYKDVMKRIDGLWFGTYYDKTSDKTYQLCRGQGDSIITADGWITIFGQNTTSACPHASNVPLGIFIRANFTINPTTNKVTINKGFLMTLDSTGSVVQSVTSLPTGAGNLTNVTNPNTVASALKITLTDGSVFDVNWDPNTSVPKTTVVQDFASTNGRYIGRTGSDVVGSDFTISAAGALTGTLIQAFPDPINKTYTCNVTPSTGYLIPGFTGYYMINNIRGECTANGVTGTLKKTWNGYAIPIHATNSPYGARESVVGSGGAASIFIMLFDAADQQIFFASDNLVLQ